MVATETLLGGAVLVLSLLLLVLLGLLLRGGGGRRRDERAPDEPAVDTDQITAAMSRSFRDLGIDDTVARVESHAEDLTEAQTSLEQMLRHPTERGGFGELQLETILGDHLPADAFGTREPIREGLRPDAHVESTEGTICIDSKFPLKHYRAFVESESDADRERHCEAFRDSVEDHLATVAEKYVRPGSGTAPFAFVFVPSEGVYHYLVTEEQDLLREYTSAGVQVVSPLTLGQKLELIRTGVHAERMSERAREVQADLDGLADRFDDVMDVWGTFYGTHFRHAAQRASDVDGELRELHREFESVSELDVEGGAGLDDAAASDDGVVSEDADGESVSDSTADVESVE